MQKLRYRLILIPVLLALLGTGCPDPATPPEVTLTLRNTPAEHTYERNIRVKVTGSNVLAYKYRLDAEPFSGERKLSQDIIETDLAAGEHILLVIAKDTEGIWQDNTRGKQIKWTIDANPELVPVAQLNDLPPEESNQSSLAVEVSGNIVAYKYSLDEDAFSEEFSVTQNIVLENLTEGSHRLRVVGKNQYNEWQTTATEYSWNIDLSPPRAELSHLPSQITSCTWLKVTIPEGDYVLYRYSLDGSPFSDDCTVDEEILAEDLAEGSHQLLVIACDSAGNWQEVSSATTFNWEIDSSGTMVDLDNVPDAWTNQVSLNISVEGDSFEAYKYRLASDDWSEERDLSQPIIVNSLEEGEQCLFVVGRDFSGNWQTERVVTWVVDVTAPYIAPLSDIPWTNTAVTLEADVSDELDCSYLWQVVQGNGQIDIQGSTTLTATLTGEAENEETYVIEFSATDQAGNRACRQFFFNWDLMMPRVDAGLDMGWLGVAAKPVPVVLDFSPVEYRWQQVSGDGTVLFDDSSLQKPLISAQMQTEEIYDLRLTVTDAAGNVASDTLRFLWDADVPGAVTDLIHETYTLQTTLTWQNPPGDISGVMIVRNTVEPYTQAVSGTVYNQPSPGGGDTLVYLGEVASYTEPDLKPGTTYYYDVYTYDKAYNYSPVNSLCLTTAIPIVYVRNSGSDLNDGFLPAVPKKSINSAIQALANRDYSGEVRVAAGSYTENIIMQDGVSILGGYNNDWSGRNIFNREDTVYRTCLEPDRHQPVITCDDLGETTKIEGFVINQPDENAVISNHNASPVIAYNTINGGYGICNGSNSSPLIRNNVITAGTGAFSFGIYNEDSSSPCIYSNVIHGGFGIKSSYGIYNKDNCAPVVRNNTISGGCPEGTSYGIYIYRSPGLIIENNIIFVSGGSIQYGIYEYFFDNPLVLRNNLLFGATYLYHDDSLGELESINEVNAQIGVQTDWSNISATTCEFVQPEEYDDPLTQDWLEMQAEGFDWHLTTTCGIDIIAGGLDFADCISHDVEGNPRTNAYSGKGFVDPTMPGAAGWSLGAYELD